MIRVPEELLSAQSAAPAEPVRQDPAQGEEAPQRLAPVPVGPSHIVGRTSGGLPKRSRRQRAISVVPEPAAGEAMAPGQSSEVTASRLGAFARGTQLGRSTTSLEGPDQP